MPSSDGIQRGETLCESSSRLGLKIVEYIPLDECEEPITNSSMMMRNSLMKMYQAMGIFKYSAHPQNNISSAVVSPDPCCCCDQNIHSAEYENWMINHPSALDSFEQMMSIAKGKKIVVFLDYDGTLSPIVDDPELAFMSDTMRCAVREVARNYPTAVISGRSRDKVYGFIQLNDVYYAGSHGMDIMAPSRQHRSSDNKYQTRTVDKMGNDAIIFRPAQDFLPEILEIFSELEEEMKGIEGVSLEDNRFCISVHFRKARKEDYDKVEERVKYVLAKHPKFHLTRGKKVTEIRPSIEWNKGNAVEYLLETLGFADSNDVFPLYIGDDRTDEDAFKVIHSRGQGFTIMVSSKAKDTRASYSLRDTSEVLSFLLRLAR